MANYYLDFVGLNTFIYEPVGWDGETVDIITSGHAIDNPQNYIGLHSSETEHHFGSISRYKNNLFSHNLPTTASFFPALMLKRNGPYGYNSFKQIRLSENPLSRKQRKENVFTFITEPGPEVLMNNDGKINMVRSKYGSLQKFTENPVYSFSKPFIVGAGSLNGGSSLERFELATSYGNETAFFNNDEINKYYGKRDTKSKQYEFISGFYLNGGLDKDGSPIDSFEYLKYRECVYPPKIYAYKNYVRQRTTFSFPWRDDRTNRTEKTNDTGFGTDITQSMWVMDAYPGWDTEAHSTGVRLNERYNYTVAGKTTTEYSTGILQNHYSFAFTGMRNPLFNKDAYLKIAPVYNRKHFLAPSASVVSPNGMSIEGINTGTTMNNLDTSHDLPSGEAKWEAGSQSGLNPFYDTYDNYIQGVRQYGKDYSIIPEFRISEHVETFQSKGLTEEITNLFSLTGALSDTADSSKTNFYKIYSNSEFMKHFEVIKKDHGGFVPPNSITLKCKAVKKFLPYEGFYPAQRSVDLAKQFYDSYKDSVAVSGATANLAGFDQADTSKFLFQNLMVPTFAPGIFFNTIKAGVACDYPLIDQNLTLASRVTQSNGDYYIDANGVFNRRIPFEAILEPEKHLAGFDIFCNEPHIYANNSGSVFWDGSGDENGLYKLMAQNFLAETNEFFMKSKEYTKIISKPSNDPNVGNAEKDKTYMMRVKMYKSKDTATLPIISGSGGFYTPSHYPSSSRETFTMYSRPSAFGPPMRPSAGGTGEDWSEKGENYAYTPPYYYGESWCDITFTATATKKYSISEIIENSTMKQWRYTKATNANSFAKSVLINGAFTSNYTPDASYDTATMGQAMHLNSSVNLFGQTTSGEAGSDPSAPPSRWTIQTKFETPMLNFNHLSASTSITLPQNASQSVPRGMWHQYGNIETDPSKGVFLQVDDVPSAWIDGWLGTTAETTGSLVDLCGFSTEAARLGEIADEKKIMEAVVAVPFIEQEGQRKFFKISRDDVERVLSKNREEMKLVGASVKLMLLKMKKYVFPPSMDFINNSTIDPFAMYIFEFRHTLKKQDLANIWQNLYPEIGRSFETAESSISHELLAHELLGGGAVLTPEGTLDVNAVGNELPDRVQWMVFKVKQRAETNYYKKIIGRQDEVLEGATVTSEGAVGQISYNWPYDFFSLVELAKIESEVEFSEREIKPDQKPRKSRVPKVRSNKPEPIGDVAGRVRASNNAARAGRLDPASTQLQVSPNTPTTTQTTNTNTEDTSGTSGTIIATRTTGGY